MLGSGLVKERPIHFLIERLAKPTGPKRDGWLALKRENRALLSGTTLVIFAPDAFPGRHEGRVWVPTPHAPEGTPLAPPAPGRPTKAQLGLWRVTLTIASEATDATASGTAGQETANGEARDAGVGSRGSAPAALWPVVAGCIHYTLPAHASYAVGSTTHPQAEALRGLRGETWGVVLGGFPQIVGVGEPREGIEEEAAAAAGASLSGALPAEVHVEIVCDPSCDPV